MKVVVNLADKDCLLKFTQAAKCENVADPRRGLGLGREGREGDW